MFFTDYDNRSNLPDIAFSISASTAPSIRSLNFGTYGHSRSQSDIYLVMGRHPISGGASLELKMLGSSSAHMANDASYLDEIFLS